MPNYSLFLSYAQLGAITQALAGEHSTLLMIRLYSNEKGGEHKRVLTIKAG